MGARQTTDSAEFNRLQQAYNQAIEAFEAATQNKKTAKKAFKKAVKEKADKQTQFLVFHELESAGLFKRLKAFQMEHAKSELKAFVKAQPKVEKSNKKEDDVIVVTPPADAVEPTETDKHVEVLGFAPSLVAAHEEEAHQITVKGFMPMDEIVAEVTVEAGLFGEEEQEAAAETLCAKPLQHVVEHQEAEEPLCAKPQQHLAAEAHLVSPAVLVEVIENEVVVEHPIVAAVPLPEMEVEILEEARLMPEAFASELEEEVPVMEMIVEHPVVAAALMPEIVEEMVLEMPVALVEVIENEAVVEMPVALVEVIENEAVIEMPMMEHEVIAPVALVEVIENEAVVEMPVLEEEHHVIAAAPMPEIVEEMVLEMPVALVEVIENEAVIEMPVMEHEVIAPVALVELIENEAVIEMPVMEHEVIAPVALVEVIENEAVIEMPVMEHEVIAPVALVEVIENEAVIEMPVALVEVIENEAVIEMPVALVEVIENEAVIEMPVMEALHVIAAAPMPEIVEEMIIETPVMEQAVALMPEIKVVPVGNATITVDLPANTPAEDAIYMSGNFNNWNAKDENYQLSRQADGNYAIQIHPPLGLIEFKLTRGSWDTTEGDSFVNRQFECGTEPLQIVTNVAAWRDLGAPTAPEKVEPLAQVIESEAVIENCTNINEAEAAAYAQHVENETIIEDCANINEVEAAAYAQHVENEAIAEVCEAIQEAEVKHDIEAESENKEALMVAEAAQVLENQAIAEACEAINEAEAKQAIEVELENKKALMVAEAAQVLENEAIAADCEKIDAAEAADEIVEHRVVASLAALDFETEIVAEVTPIVETQVVEHQVIASAPIPMILTNETVTTTTTHEVVEAPAGATQVIEQHTITNSVETKSVDHDTHDYDHWERDQKFVGDDLKIIEGIGPKIEQLLNDIGILTHRQLSLMKVEFLSELLKTAGKKYASHDPATWPAQAKLAASGKMGELKKLQERIVYGHLDA